jgi:hypothetical protein
MTFLTAMTIQLRGEDIICTAAGPSEEGKYSGFIELHTDGEYDHLLISSNPVYDSKLDAVNGMLDVVKQVREAEL